MSDTITVLYWFICEGLIFLSFIVICALLLKRRFGYKTSLMIFGAFILGVCIINGVLLTGHPALQVLGLLPLTAYLPMIICLHILSKSTFFQTGAIWSIGLVGYFILQFSLEFIKNLALQYVTCPYDMVVAISGIILIATFIIFVLFKKVRDLFVRYVLEQCTNWIILWLPLFFLLILFSYFSNSVSDPKVFLLLFLMAVAIFFLQFQALIFTDETLRLRKMESEYAMQMGLQKHDYETICKKLEIGRAYRHDMRHHLAVLNGSLEHGSTDEALAYIQSLSNQFNQVEWRTYCENPMLNAVVSFYSEMAKEIECEITTKVMIPKETVFEDIDLCAILSNSLENAIHACEKIPDKSKRKIGVTALWEENKVVFSVENSCMDQLEFDEDGFPVVSKREGHGIGLKSIEGISKKYGGLFLCSLEDKVFKTQAALFKPQSQIYDKENNFKKPGKKVLLTMCFVVLVFVNSAPEVSQALEDIPIIGSVVKVITLENYKFRWGDTGINAELPAVTGDAVTGNANKEMETYVEQLRQEFIQYVSVKHQGYAGMDSTYEVLSDSDTFLTVIFDTTINAGGSESIRHAFTLDKKTAEIIELKDLFKVDSGYIGIISDEILKQMTMQVEAGTADYFVPGGIWSDDECFKAIEADQNFYINENDEIVIIFDEYTVAPGSMGNPEFIIPDEVIAGIKK